DGFDTAAIGFIAPSLLGEWNLTKPDLAPVLSAALFGLACGALVSGPLSDKLGRRSLLLGSVFLFGVACLMSAFSTTIGHLTILRFITGVGLGAAMPNTTTLLSEYAPQRTRALLITVMFTGFKLGSALIGFVAGWLIPLHGWRAVLLFGGGLPLLLLPGGVFVSRLPGPVLQQIEDFEQGDVSANDCFRPVTRYFDRITSPEQLL
ncbi:hypothetical protein C3L29_032845, partial [Pseudomonas sp. MWU12-2534b]